MFKKGTLAFLFVLFGLSTQAQFGFEWIRPYQPYFKFKIAQKGVYRIDSVLLANAGFSQAILNTSKIQLFKNGIEQPIFTNTGTDNILNANEFIIFWAESNDGKLDTELYRTAQEQPHTFKSLYTDTAIYFLTLLPDTSLVQPKRFTFSTDTLSTGIFAEPFYQQQVILTPQQEYYRGGALPSSERYYISEYADAEGWTSNLVGLGQSQNFELNTPDAVTSGNASISIKVIGASDFFISNPNLPNHHIRIYAGPNLNPTFLIADTTYRGYGERLINKLIPANLLGTKTYIRLEVVNDLGVTSDFNALSFISLVYNKQGNQFDKAFEEFDLTNFSNQPRNRINFTNFNFSNAAFLDLTLNRFVLAAQNGNNCYGIFSFTPQPRKYVLFSLNQTQAITNITQVNFKVFEPNDFEFLLVSNRQLNLAAEQYRQYRSNKYKTLLAYVDELNDYYFYGYHHPLAIKRFAMHFHTVQTVKPQFLLLLGRGYQNNLVRNNLLNYNLNLVPAIGEPASDNMFTSANNGVPLIATGRIPATNNIEAQNYLNKLIRIETGADSINLWRKHFLHLSGGTYLSQQQQFTGVVNTLKNMIIQKPTGANVFSYHKNTTLPTQTNLRQTLINHLNDGINLMTFLGHGSLTVLDMDFGGINDLIENNKPTFYYFNGCNIGNASDIDPLGTGLVYGKDFVCAANKGAIGWLAHSNITLTSLLFTQMNRFYEQLSGVGYGKPVGLNIRNALQASVIANDEYGKSHALQLVLQGDPAFVIYGPTLPDAFINDNDLFISPPNANALMDSIAVGIIIKNLARATTDSIMIECRRTLPNNTTILKTAKVPLPLYMDTFYIWFNINKTEIGNNVFNVNLNASRNVQETNYNNNSETLNFFLPGSGVRLLMPYQYQGVGNNDSIELVVQNNNIIATNSEYIFEIDNTPYFKISSPFYKTSGVIKSNSLAKWKIKLGNNYKIVYWRAKLNVPESEGGVWQTSSFYLESLQSGPLNNFGKFDYYQFKNNSASNFIMFNDSTKKVEFADDEFTLGIENRRWDHRRMGVTIPYLLNAGVGSCISQGVVALVFSPFRADYPEELANYPFNCAFVQANKNDPSIRYYTFNTNTVAGEDELKRFIDSIPQNYYVAMFSRYSSNIQNWSQTNKDALKKIGSTKAVYITSANTAWALIGQKNQFDVAAEDTITNNDLENAPNLPPLDNEPQDIKPIEVRRSVKQKWFYGNYTTDLFGPTKQWQYAIVNAIPKQTGRYWYDIIGVKFDGSDTVLALNQTNDIYPLNHINPLLVQFIKFRINFVDSVGREPHQMSSIAVSYIAPDEVTIYPDAGYNFYNNQLQQGDSVSIQIPFLNIGSSQFDSALITLNVFDENRINRYTFQTKSPYIPKGSVYLFKHKFNTANLGSNNTLNISFNSDNKVPEYILANNFFSTGFNVIGDTKKPLIDITFDGQRIMNGDIVSPNPIIKITSTDDNRFLKQTDTSTFMLWFKKPGNNDFERINLSSQEVQFIPANEKSNIATLIFTPKNLTDGLHTIKVQATDGAGNEAGTDAYETEFNVITKSTITHFYPYPNPFTTHTRFVFTLTGSVLPDDLMIRIYTVSGKLVKEINKQEFGSIRIGNNISEYAWDGTDMFGDRLANGVYLYQVLTRINGKNIEKRNTRARDENSYFINNTGKIYMMR
ncbi:MAG: C25 family cysteine peptidase [Bacteroidia bacterium]